MRGGTITIPSRLSPWRERATSEFMRPCQMRPRKDLPSLTLQPVFPAKRIEIDHRTEEDVDLMWALGQPAV